MGKIKSYKDLYVEVTKDPNNKIPYNHGVDIYSFIHIGDEYGDFKVIDVGKYIYRGHGYYGAIVEVQCKECGLKFFVRDIKLLNYGKDWKCDHSSFRNIPANSRTINNIKVGSKIGDLKVIDFLYTHRVTIRGRSTEAVCNCTACGVKDICFEVGDLTQKKIDSCGCKTAKRVVDKGLRKRFQIGDIVNQWKILEFVGEDREKSKRPYFYYKCECQCCGEIKIINSKVLTKQKCKKRKDGQINYIKEMKEKLVYSSIPEFAPDLIGFKTGTLEVISYSFHVGKGYSSKQRYWLTKCCICGKISCHYEGELVREEVFSDGCLDSFGELRISNFLLKQNIPFVSQKFFEDCKDIRLLPYDFYIYNSKEKEWFLLEFQGSQHTKSCGFGSKNAEKKFKDTQRKDRIKAKYAKNHNIRLELIYYKDLNNVEKILCDILCKKFSIKMIANVDELQILQKDFKKLRDEATKEKRRIRKTKEYKQKENHKAINFVITDNQIVREEDFNNAN